MLMFEIWVYCDPPKRFGRLKILQLPILGTKFLNPGLDPAARTNLYSGVYPPILKKSVTVMKLIRLTFFPV